VQIPKIFLFITLLFCGYAKGQNELSEISSFGSNPGKLKMFLHFSKSNTDSSQNKPLIVVLHGCYQNAQSVSEETGWNKLADQFGFYVLYPQQKFSNNASLCFNWFRKKDISKDKGETASIHEMILYLKNHFKIDSTKIFIYGLSAGAEMGVTLAANYPALFNTVCSIAGGPFKADIGATSALKLMNANISQSQEEWAAEVKKLNPSYTGKYPGLIILYGTNDNVVSISNSNEFIKQWTCLQKTDTIADQTIKDFQGNQEITKFIYKDSLNNNVVVFYKINNLRHALPIEPGDEITKGGKMDMFTTNIGFHSTYWIAVDMGMISK
jgi:poly(hydroxyalkanoate) depolymerase family esterase